MFAKQAADLLRVAVRLSKLNAGVDDQLSREALPAAIQLGPPAPDVEGTEAGVLGDKIEVLAESQFSDSIGDRRPAHLNHGRLAVAGKVGMGVQIGGQQRGHPTRLPHDLDGDWICTAGLIRG